MLVTSTTYRSVTDIPDSMFGPVVPPGDHPASLKLRAGRDAHPDEVIFSAEHGE